MSIILLLTCVGLQTTSTSTSWTPMAPDVHNPNAGELALCSTGYWRVGEHTVLTTCLTETWFADLLQLAYTEEGGFGIWRTNNPTANLEIQHE